MVFFAQTFVIQLLGLWCIVVIASANEPCPFSSPCVCVENSTINCINVTTFPTFPQLPKNSSYLGGTLLVTGSFSSIPSCAFVNILPQNVHLRRESGQENLPISIDDGAFTKSYNVTSNHTYVFVLPYNQIIFENFNAMTTIPTVPLGWTQIISLLSFRRCSSYILSGSASLFNVEFFTLEFLDCGMTNISLGVFQTLFTIDKYNLKLDSNLFEEPPEALRTHGFYSISLVSNRISKIPDNAFSLESGVKGNDQLDAIYLDKNPIRDNISDNAFNNLTKLQELRLTQCELTKVPTKALQQVASTLVTLYLSENQIKVLEKDAFANLTHLTALYLESNPIISIEVGAFSDLPLDILNVVNLQLLPSFDVSATRGMTGVAMVNVKDCPLLRTLELSDEYDLPNTLGAVLATNGNLQSVSNRFQYWLKKYSFRKLDISNNKNFTCDSGIDWMEDFICNQQIVVTNTRCARTGQMLLSYLAPDCGNGSSKFQPLFSFIICMAVFLLKFAFNFQ